MCSVQFATVPVQCWLQGAVGSRCSAEYFRGDVRILGEMLDKKIVQLQVSAVQCSAVQCRALQ